MASIASRSAASPSVSASAQPASTVPTSIGSIDDSDPLTIQFTTVQELFAAINCAPGDFLTATVTTNHHLTISPSSFAEIVREGEQRRRNFCFITIPTDLHEQLHHQLYDSFRDQLVRSGRENTWTTLGTATCQGQGHPGGDCGEGDSTGGPIPDRDMKRVWPALVVEAGVSQSLAGLRQTIRWWFSASDHQVQLVLLAKFEPTRCAIILERWEEEPSATRPGAMTTRNAAALQPVLQQTIAITQDASAEPISYQVASSALVLRFKLLFLRDPGPGEGDFVLSVQDLENYARDVLRYM
ncbi:hypothetical protein C8A05DRAFT_46804 [Staphylotrichum tortipilum]|uniref:Uncharacterized protein n=1 Tax=Staphylotrichum tortipilum TaxID=2831512 RepID=A0AAN6RQ97_9PEZI|nr:hypothetical protein C8A05DRAFT_46804 [Staphylotrichum longicolle]